MALWFLRNSFRKGVPHPCAVCKGGNHGSRKRRLFLSRSSPQKGVPHPCAVCKGGNHGSRKRRLFLSRSSPQKGVPHPCAVCRVGTTAAESAGFSSVEFTTERGAPPLRSLQGWEPRQQKAPAFISRVHHRKGCPILAQFARVGTTAAESAGFHQSSSPQKGVPHPCAVCKGGNHGSRKRRLSSVEFTTERGAPPLRSLQGWEPRQQKAPAFISRVHHR